MLDLLLWCNWVQIFLFFIFFIFLFFILFVNLKWETGYEVSDACTSIVAEDARGNILHTRNLDFWDGYTLADQLRDIACIFDMTKGGKTLFRFSSPVGYMGALSGQVPGQFSVTIDTRFYPNG